VKKKDSMQKKLRAMVVPSSAITPGSKQHLTEKDDL
jgi:hypothetical protein